MNNLKHFTLLAIFTIAFVFLACDNNSNPKLCECPNGTLHLIGEICCYAEGCNCETGIEGVRHEFGIPITNRGGDLENFDLFCDKTITALDWLDIYDFDEEAAFVKNNIKEIRLVVSLPENNTHVYNYPGIFASAIFEDGKYIVFIKEKLLSNVFLDINGICNIFYNLAVGDYWEIKSP